MKPTISLICILFFLGTPLATAQAPATQQGTSAETASASKIVAHPKELKFSELQFDAPEASKYRHVLPSGVVVYVVEDSELPLVDVQLTIRAGEYLDPPGKEGLASLVSGQLRAGGTKASPPEEFDEEVDFLAALISTSVSGTEASASLNCLTKDLDRTLVLFFDMLRTPRFDEKRLTLEKSQILQNLARRNDRTASIERREWTALLRGRDHYRSDRVTKASTEASTREDLLAFHQKYYHPKNFIFAVSGDTKTKEILQKLEASCKDWPGDANARQTAPLPTQPNSPSAPGVYMVNKSDVNQGRVRLGHPSIRRSDPDFHSVLIMNHILGGGGFTSRIMARVRSDEGLAYSAGSRVQFGIYDKGNFESFFQSKSATVLQAASIVLEEIDRIRSEPVTQEELDTAINFAVGLFPSYFATSSAVASTFANDEFTRRQPDFWKTYRDKVKAVTVETVQASAKKHLHPDKVILLIVGNTEEISKGNEKVGKQFLTKVAGEKGVQTIALPDPLTLVYP